jgi:hypothetical protein
MLSFSKNTIKTSTSELVFVNLSMPRGMSSMIKAFQSIDKLHLKFLDDIGNIEVVIYNEEGNIVYQRNVDTLGKNQVSIDISAFEQGNYEIRLIRFTNSQEQFMYGEFEID